VPALTSGEPEDRVVHNLPLTGRSRLIDLVSQRLDSGAHIMLRGPAGIGKTRVAAEVTTSDLLGGRAIDRILASQATTSFQLGALAPLGRPTGVAAGDLPALMSWYLGRWRSQQRNGRPAILWLDDAQNVDDLSASVIRQAVVLGSVQLIATHRTPEALPDDVEALVTEGQLKSVDVPPLNRSMTKDLAESAAQRPLTASQLDQLHELTAGFPLYVRDLAMALGDTDEAPNVGDMGEVLGARFAGLSAEERRTAEMVAAAEPVDLALFADRRESVTSLIDQGLLRRQGASQVRLEHPLYGAWLLDSLGPLVSQLYRDLADRATSLDSDDPVDPVQELDWRLKAGDEPGDVLIAEATRLAIERSDGPTALRFTDDRTNFELLRGQALLISGDFEGGTRLLESVLAQGQPGDRAEAASWLARYVGVGLQDYDRALAILDEADDISLPTSARELLMIGRLWIWTFGTAIPDDVDEQLAGVLDLDVLDGSKYELALLGVGLVHQVRPSDATQPLVDYLRRVEQHTTVDPNSVCRARCVEAWKLVFEANPVGGIEILDRHLEVARSGGNAEGVSLIGGVAALIAALLGRIQQSNNAATEAFAATQGQDWFRFGALATEIGRGNASLAGRGRRAWLVQAENDPTAEGAMFADLERLLSARAEVLERQSRGQAIDEAVVLPALERLVESNRRSWVAAFVPEYADRTVPLRVFELLRDTLSADQSWRLPRMAHQLATARLDGRHDLLLAVAGEYEGIGFAPAASRAFADVAVMEPADSPLRPAAVQGVIRSLRDWDGGPTWWTAPIEGLPTARQLQIMWQVVAGQRPPEIASHLGLSTRTVENHLYRVYKSLGLSGQEELIAVMSVSNRTLE